MTEMSLYRHQINPQKYIVLDTMCHHSNETFDEKIEDGDNAAMKPTVMDTIVMT